MRPSSLNYPDSRGFTLVELMIVMAIIGVMATMAVPGYKRMIQVARKQEAKSALGALYSAEQAFFAENGVYGNNLQRVFYRINSIAIPGGPFYTVGFPNSSCTSGPSTVQPPFGSVLGQTLNTNYCNVFGTGYYQVAPLPAPPCTGCTAAGPCAAPTAPSPLQPVPGGTPSPFFFSLAFTGNRSGPGRTAQCVPDPTGGGLVALSSLNFKDGSKMDCLTIDVCNHTPKNGIKGIANAFVASASGVISPNAPDGSPNSRDYDWWTIDNEGTLRNIQDGVK